MSKNIEQCIRDGNKAFNNAVKIMLKHEMKRIAKMEEELLKRAVEMIRTDDSNIDLKIFVCPIISFAFNGQKNYLYEIRDNKKDETELIDDCIKSHTDLYTSANPKALPILFNTFIKQTLDEHGFVVSGVYDTVFNGRKIRYRITHQTLTDLEIELAE